MTHHSSATSSTFTHTVPARAGILGNPSDGYGGRTLATTIDHFGATVTLTANADHRPSPAGTAANGDVPLLPALLTTAEPPPAPAAPPPPSPSGGAPPNGVMILPGADDAWQWDSLDAMNAHIDRHGFGTGQQLLAAAVRTFAAVADSVGQPLAGGFTLSYHTTIPRQVGLGGSSALVVAAMRCLSAHSGLNLPDPVLASVALSCETDQLGITAGLQDRVVQVYGGLVAMDFGHMTVDHHFGVRCGTYQRVDHSGLPPLFLAYRLDAAEPSGDYHRQLRERYEAGDSHVRAVLRELASLVVEGRAALRWGDRHRFGHLMAKNMRLRQSLGPLPAHQMELVEIAESEGACATFAGSGGAVIGAYRDHAQLEALTAAYGALDAPVVAVNEPPPAATRDASREPVGRQPALAVVEPLRPGL